MANLFKKIIGVKNKEEESEDEWIEGYEQDQEKEISIQDNSGENDEVDEWMEEDYEEGQLSIDVYQDDKNIYLKSTIAGVKPEDIDISINNDMLTIRGKREDCEEISEEEYLFKECYWGSFSRSVILPTEVKSDKIEASLENGVLKIKIPKAGKEKPIKVKVKT